ncbi:MAG: hypothetical protein K2P84_05890 [Undibacterium sp.]|nr:hypothetical protein [Undibacterium sp.]
MSIVEDYLRYLPAVYATSDPEFLSNYLKIFQKILTGIDDQELNGRRGIQELLAAEVIGNLFYPRLSFLFPASDTDFIPPISGAKSSDETAILSDLNSYIGVPTATDPLAEYLSQTQTVSASSSATDSQDSIITWLNDFLIWLGSWIGLVVDNSWSIDKKRTVMAQVWALYRQRGSLAGLAMMCNLVLDLPLSVKGITYNDDGTTSEIVGDISLEFSNPQVLNITCQDQASTAFILNYTYPLGSPVVGGYLPWLFQVQMDLPNKNNPDFILTKSTVQQVQMLYAQLQQLLISIKPAATHFQITIEPSMQLQVLGHATNLDNNTLLGN